MGDGRNGSGEIGALIGAFICRRDEYLNQKSKPTMKQYYYIDGQSQIQGQVPGRQLVDMLNARTITPETQIVPAGETQWRPLSQFRQQTEPATPSIDPAAQEFYVHQNGQTLGPYSANQLEEKRSNNAFHPQAQVGRGGMEKWVPMASFAGGAILGFLAATFLRSSQAGHAAHYSYDFGDGETYDAIYLDMDGNGTIDAVAIDTDHDGRADLVGLDTDGDGRIDVVGRDVDHDGQVDVVGVDTNHDGRIDVVGADSNGDGTIDLVAADSNYDGMVDMVAADTNHDGSFDVAAADTNYDGVADIAATDTDASGVTDLLSDLLG